MMRQISDAFNLNYKYKLSNVERMILVSDVSNAYSHLVFVGGSFLNPKISYIVEENIEDIYLKSQLLEGVREYGDSKTDILAVIERIEDERIFYTVSREDFASHSRLREEYKREANRKSSTHNRNKQDREGSGGKDSGSVKLRKIRNNSKWLYQPDPQTDLSDLRKNPIPFVGIGEDAQYTLNESKILYIEPNKKRTQAWLTATGLEMPGPSDNVGVLDVIKPQAGGNVNTEDAKHSLRMADQTSPVTPYGRDTLPTFGEGKEAAGAMETAEAAAQQKSRSLIGTLSLSP